MKIPKKPIELYTMSGAGYLRVLSFYFFWKDTTKYRLSFSERNGFVKHIMVGKWSFCFA